METPRTQPKKTKAAKDWDQLTDTYVAQLSTDGLRALSEELGVTPEALKALGVGWNKGTGNYTFPERDHRNTVVGIATRGPKGKKGFIKGGHRGLVLPNGWQNFAEPILIVEGPSDVAAARSMGLSAIGRPSNNGGANILQNLLGDRRIIFVGENDQKPDGTWPGKDGAHSVAQQLAYYFGQPVSVSLPPASYKDIRGYLNESKLALDDRANLHARGAELLRHLESNVTIVEPAVLKNTLCPYDTTTEGLIWNKPIKDEIVPIQLTNFTARIVAEIECDDGAEKQRSFEIECVVGEQTIHFVTPAGTFGSMSWVIEHLGARAVVFAGTSVKDHIRVAIQLQSGDQIQQQKVFAHTGWRMIDGKWFYLHSDGAVGANGQDTTIQTDLPDSLKQFSLPSPSQHEVTKCVQSSLRMLKLLPSPISVPLFSTIFRSVLVHHHA